MTIQYMRVTMNIFLKLKRMIVDMGEGKGLHTKSTSCFYLFLFLDIAYSEQNSAVQKLIASLQEPVPLDYFYSIRKDVGSCNSLTST